MKNVTTDIKIKNSIPRKFHSKFFAPCINDPEQLIGMGICEKVYNAHGLAHKEYFLEHYTGKPLYIHYDGDIVTLLQFGDMLLAFQNMHPFTTVSRVFGDFIPEDLFFTINRKSYEIERLIRDMDEEEREQVLTHYCYNVGRHLELYPFDPILNK